MLVSHAIVASVAMTMLTCVLGGQGEGNQEKTKPITGQEFLSSLMIISKSTSNLNENLNLVIGQNLNEAIVEVTPHDAVWLMQHAYDKSKCPRINNPISSLYEEGGSTIGVEACRKPL